MLNRMPVALIYSAAQFTFQHVILAVWMEINGEVKDV